MPSKKPVQAARPVEVAAGESLPPRAEHIVYTIGHEVGVIARLLVAVALPERRHVTHAPASCLTVLASVAMDLEGHTPLDQLEPSLFPMGDPQGLRLLALDAPAGLR